MFLAGVGAKDDPSSGGRQMPSHWGDKRAQHRLAVEPDRHAVPAGDRRRRSRPSLRERRRQSKDRAERFQPDEVVYVSVGDGATSEGEFWESLNAACLRQAAGRLRRRGQRLRDLSAGRSADRRRRHLASSSASFPGLFVQSRRRHRLPREPSRDARGRRATRARARVRRSSTRR